MFANCTNRWPNSKVWRSRSKRRSPRRCAAIASWSAKRWRTVDNAIKYAGPEAAKVNGAAAEIVLGAGADGDRIALSVADHGPGIPDADRGRVVERFVRLEASRSLPGSGLGLSLASAVARLHGGELKLEDNHPGLRSVLALPRADP